MWEPTRNATLMTWRPLSFSPVHRTAPDYISCGISQFQFQSFLYKSKHARTSFTPFIQSLLLCKPPLSPSLSLSLLFAIMHIYLFIIIHNSLLINFFWVSFDLGIGFWHGFFIPTCLPLGFVCFHPCVCCHDWLLRKFEGTLRNPELRSFVFNHFFHGISSLKQKLKKPRMPINV